MNPAKVRRDCLVRLTDLPNIGPSLANDLRAIGIYKPSDLVGQDPLVMYDDLCRITGIRHDPCVIDVFMSVTRFMAGEDPQVWWKYTTERKATLAAGGVTELRHSAKNSCIAS